MKQLLLIIDAQQALIDGNQETGQIFSKEKLIITINKVINKAIAATVPVIFVRDLDVAEGQGDGFQIHNEITVPTEAKIFDKSATNSFYGTGLLEHLTTQHNGHYNVDHFSIVRNSEEDLFRPTHNSYRDS